MRRPRGDKQTVDMEIKDYPLFGELTRDERMAIQRRHYYAVTFIIPDCMPKAGHYVAICRDLDTARHIKATVHGIPGVKRVIVTRNSTIQPYKRVITDLETIIKHFDI